MKLSSTEYDPYKNKEFRFYLQSRANSLNRTSIERGIPQNSVYFHRIFAQDLWNIIQNQDWLCYYCYTMVVPDCKRIGCSLEFDHVIPGIHLADNLVACCRDCNRRKDDSTLSQIQDIYHGVQEFYETKFPVHTYI